VGLKSAIWAAVGLKSAIWAAVGLKALSGPGLIDDSQGLMIGWLGFFRVMFVIIISTYIKNSKY